MPDSTYSARINQSSANNNAINLNDGLTAIDITFVPVTGSGDYIIGDDPVLSGGNLVDGTTQVVIGTGTYEFSLVTTGTMPGANGKYPSEFNDTQVVIIRVYDYPSDGESTRFVFWPELDPDATLTNQIQQGNITPDGQSITPPVACFCVGTLIETPQGPRPVEDLIAGDLVMTADQGAQPVIWAGKSHLTWPGADDLMKPIQIKAGALGDAMPAQDLMVSQQHHVLIDSTLCEEMFGTRQVLAPAKGLTGLPGVRWMLGKKEATFCHVLLEQHAILTSNGAPSESFYPGKFIMNGLSENMQQGIRSVLPALTDDVALTYGNTARLRLTRRQAEALVKQMLATSAARSLSAA